MMFLIHKRPENEYNKKPLSAPLAPILKLEVTAIQVIKVKLDLPRQSSRVDIYDVSYKVCFLHFFASSGGL